MLNVGSNSPDTDRRTDRYRHADTDRNADTYCNAETHGECHAQADAFGDPADHRQAAGRGRYG